MSSLYRMPAEWEKHKATWLSWPKNAVTWPGKKLKEVQNIYLKMIAGLLEGEGVQLLVPDHKTCQKVLSLLPRNAKTSRLYFYPTRYVDGWIRDYGPIFVGRRPKTRRALWRVNDIAITKWIFNAWGGKYSDLARDNEVVNRVDYFKNFKRWNPGIILEGGSIDVNGQGTLLTTEQCLLNPNRNRHLSRQQIETYLKKFLGIQKVIWLKEGIEGDDTDGHVDDITRFVNANTILTAVEANLGDKNHEYLSENLEILKESTDAQEKSFKIIELPMPGFVGPARKDTPLQKAGGPSARHKRLPASYANFYIGNAVVLVPIYSHANDKKAVKIIQKCFPNKRIVPIECTPLVYGLGSIHCVTQQEPR